MYINLHYVYGRNLIKTFRDQIQNMKHFFSHFVGVLGPLHKIQGYQNVSKFRPHQSWDLYQGKQLTTSFSYMGQNVKNLYFWLFGVCVGGGGFNDQTGHILLSSYPLTHIYDHVK